MSKFRNELWEFAVDLSMPTDPLILDLRRVKRLRETAAAAQEAATDATEPAIVAALKAGIGPTEIAAETGVSDSHVRAIRRKNGLPANPSYAHLKPPTRQGDDS